MNLKDFESSENTHPDLKILIEGYDDVIHYVLNTEQSEPMLVVDADLESWFQVNEKVLITLELVNDGYYYDMEMYYKGRPKTNKHAFTFDKNDDFEEMKSNIKVMHTIVNESVAEKRFEDKGYYRKSKLKPTSKRYEKRDILKTTSFIILLLSFIVLCAHLGNINKEQAYSKVVVPSYTVIGDMSSFKIGTFYDKGKEIDLQPKMTEKYRKMIDLNKKAIIGFEKSIKALEDSITAFAADESVYKNAYAKRKPFFEMIIESKNKSGKYVSVRGERLRAILGKLNYEMFTVSFAKEISNLNKDLVFASAQKVKLEADNLKIEQSIIKNTFVAPENLIVYGIYDGGKIEFITDKDPYIYTLVQFNLSVPKNANKAYYSFKYGGDDNEYPCKIIEANRNVNVAGNFDKEKLNSTKFKLYKCIPDKKLPRSKIGQFVALDVTLNVYPDALSHRYENYEKKGSQGKKL